MSVSQSATAPSTPLMPHSESPSVLTPNSMFTGTPVRRRYSRSVSQGNRTVSLVTLPPSGNRVLFWLRFVSLFTCKQLCRKSTGQNWTKYGVQIFADIVDNKEFYLSTEVRPPFTYASLIRQVSGIFTPPLCSK